MLLYINSLKGGVTMARDLTRVTVNLKTELVEQIDAYAEELGLTRTSGVAVLLSQAINNQKVINNMDDLIKAYRREQNNG